jgi:hypothetical protein
MTQIIHCLLARKDTRTDLTEKHASHPVSHAIFRLMFIKPDEESAAALTVRSHYRSPFLMCESNKLLTVGTLLTLNFCASGHQHSPEEARTNILHQLAAAVPLSYVSQSQSSAVLEILFDSSRLERFILSLLLPF